MPPVLRHLVKVNCLNIDQCPGIEASHLVEVVEEGHFSLGPFKLGVASSVVGQYAAFTVEFSIEKVLGEECLVNTDAVFVAHCGVFVLVVV